MTGRSSETPIRRRVRTGCLTCRHRRRKCDEAKPMCDNCTTKNLTCRYGVKITFVPSKGQNLLEEHGIAGTNVVRGASVPSTFSTSVERHPNVEAIDSYIEPLQGPSQPHSLDERTFINHYIHASEHQIVDNEHDSNDQGTELDIVPSESTTTCVPSSHVETEETSAMRTRPLLSPPTLRQRERSQNTAFMPSEFRSRFSTDFEIEQYEHELLRHYRYKIANVLDLGRGSAYYGVQIMLMAAKSPCLYNIILAMAACHRAATDGAHHDLDAAMSTLWAKEVLDDNRPCSQKELIVIKTMTLWKAVIVSPPHLWVDRLCDLDLYHIHELVQIEDRIVLLRFVLAAILMSPADCTSSVINHVLSGDLVGVPSTVKVNHAQYELYTSLLLLARTIQISLSAQRAASPLLPAWQSCWCESEDWYAHRSLEMQEIFEAADTKHHTLPADFAFPLPLFSNSCAILANIIHDLAAMLLLQHKPRLVKLAARDAASTSLIWHVQRIVGIAEMAVEANLWDPIVVSAVALAAKRLSHSKQLHVVVKVLVKLATISGIRLDAEIEEFTSVDYL